MTDLPTTGFHNRRPKSSSEAGQVETRSDGKAQEDRSDRSIPALRRSFAKPWFKQAIHPDWHPRAPDPLEPTDDIPLGPTDEMETAHNAVRPRTAAGCRRVRADPREKAHDPDRIACLPGSCPPITS